MFKLDNVNSLETIFIHLITGKNLFLDNKGGPHFASHVYKCKAGKIINEENKIKKHLSSKLLIM